MVAETQKLIIDSVGGRLERELAGPSNQALLRELQEHRDVFEATAIGLVNSFPLAVQVLETTFRSGGKVLLFGNGGSAADAQHLAAEFVIRYQANRRPLPAIALTTDTSALTACGNDLGFDAIFERQVEALGRSPDSVLAFSTSGNSSNVLRGLIQAKAMNLTTVGFTGATGGKMATVCDALILVPSNVTARIQELHITIGHVICKVLEQRLGLV
jgi:D-sedoheptulose 7-phosphate isomerase